MNVQELMTLTFQLAGEPSDLCPYVTPGDLTTFDNTLALQGAQNLLAWINMGLVRIANWEYSDGTILRLRHLWDSFNFKKGAYREELVISATNDTITVSGFSADTNNRVDQFKGWIVEVTAGIGIGQKRYVIGCTGAGAANCVVQVNSDWDTNPDATSTVQLYKRFINFVPAPVADSIDDYHVEADGLTRIADILRVRDITTATDLTWAPRTEMLTAGLMISGIPSLYRFDGNTLTFDVALNADRSYEVVYYSHPTPITNVTDPIPLPVPFHEAIMYWVVHSIQLKNQDFTGAYAIKRDLQELMQTLRNVGEFNMETETAGVRVWG